MQNVVSTTAAGIMSGNSASANAQGCSLERPMNSREVAALFGKSKQYAYKAIENQARKRQVPGHFKLGQWIFFPSELDAWAKDQVHSTCQSCLSN
jgi:predicted DNA-binding transcriptional regulator AlpA